MTNKITTCLALTALAAALAAPGAFAQSAEGQGFVRGEIGRNLVKDKGDSARSSSFSLRGGYMFNPNFGVEAFYSRLYNKTTNFVDPVAGNFNDRVRMSAVGVGAIGKVRFGDQAAESGFFGTARAGLMRTSYRDTYAYKEPGATAGSWINTSGTFTSNSINPYVGVGVGYDFDRNMGVSLNYDWSRTKLKDAGAIKGSGMSLNNNTLSAGFEYRF